MIGQRLRMDRMACLAIVAFAAFFGSSRAEEPAGLADSTHVAGEAHGAAPADSTGSEPPTALKPPPAEVDPLQQYLKGLSDSTNSYFDDEALRSLSISDAEVDSLLRVYEETGDAFRTRPTSWQMRFGLQGVRYNRVEGFNVSPKMTLVPPTERPASLEGRVGYAWSAKEWTGGVEAKAELTRRSGRPTIHASWERDIFSYGSGLIGGNTLTALMLGKDYGDYFRGEGWAAGVQFTPGPMRFDATYRQEEQESIANAADFTVFEGDDAFRPNVAVDDGRAHFVEFTAGYALRSQAPFSGQVTGRVAGYGLGGQFDYTSLHGELAARQRVFWGDLVTARISGGTVERGAPWQALHLLGGFETLRGYEINEFPARTFGHLRLDDEFGTDVFAWIPYVRSLRIQPVVFADGAGLFDLQGRNGEDLGGGGADWKSSAGIGLQKNLLGIPGGGGVIRFEIARRFDRGEDNMTYRGQITLSR